MDWPTVVNDAVKIGLGALIAGAVTYAVLVRTQKHELRKLRDERYEKALLFCSDKAVELSSFMRGYVGIVLGRLSVQPPATAQILQELMRDRYGSKWAEFEASGNALKARLLLLGLTDIRRELANGVEKFIEFSNAIDSGGPVPSVSEATECGTAINTAGKKFHELLGEEYERRFKPHD